MMLVLFADNWDFKQQVCISNTWVITNNNSLYVGAEAFTQATYGEGVGRIWLSNVECTGNERMLTNCSANINVTGCAHAQDAGVRCQPGKDDVKQQAQSWY